MGMLSSRSFLDPWNHFPAPEGTVRNVIFLICHSARIFIFFAGREMSSLLSDRDKFSRNKYNMVQISSMTWHPGSSGIQSSWAQGSCSFPSNQDPEGRGSDLQESSGKVLLCAGCRWSLKMLTASWSVVSPPRILLSPEGTEAVTVKTKDLKLLGQHTCHPPPSSLMT